MGKRVLVTDDTAFMRMTLRNVLEKNGYEVIGEAADGEEAVALYAELRPDVVTMDITMPKMDGITAIKKILEMDPNAKVIVCSAMGQKPMVIEALNAGAKDFLVKPFQPERIIEALRKVSG
ncbi:MAG TPA: response regulator [Firmicutes bacterium]|nr:response regulator [Bacillota bacterium]